MKTTRTQPACKPPAADPETGWPMQPLYRALKPSSEKVEPSEVPNAWYLSLEHIEPHSRRILGRGKATDVQSTKTVFRSGDVLYGKLRPYLNKVTVPDFDGVCSTDIFVFPKSESFNSRYLMYWLNRQEVVEYTNHLSAGVQLPRISFDDLGQLEIPLPPLPEQERIVEAIERLTARVDAARDRLANVPAILKRFRQAVLAAACSGRLTEDWREASGHEDGAVDLLRRTETVRSKAGRIPRVTGVPDDLDAPAGWSPAYFGNLLTLLTSGSRGWAEFYSDTGPLFIRSQDINTDELVLTDMAHVDPPQSADRARTRAKRYDVLLTITGANVTKCAHISADLPEAYVSQHVALCRLAVPELSPFVHLWLTSPQHGRKVLLDNAYGAGKPGLNLDNIKDVPVALPSLAEQAEIVRRVESLMKLADTIERRVSLAQARADKLTQSILAKAFRGELVPAGFNESQARVQEDHYA